MTGKVQFEGDAVSVDSRFIMRGIGQRLCGGGGREEGLVVERNLRLKRT